MCVICTEICSIQTHLYAYVRTSRICTRYLLQTGNHGISSHDQILLTVRAGQTISRKRSNTEHAYSTGMRPSVSEEQPQNFQRKNSPSSRGKTILCCKKLPKVCGVMHMMACESMLTWNICACARCILIEVCICFFLFLCNECMYV